MDCLHWVCVWIHFTVSYAVSVNLKSLICDGGLTPIGTISASSQFTERTPPQFSCLGNIPDLDLDNAGAWCSMPDGEHWIQVDLLDMYQVHKIRTQGLAVDIDGVRYRKWVTLYKISYGIGIDQLITKQNSLGEDDVFIGNNDTNSQVENDIGCNIYAKYIRLTAVAVAGLYNSYPVACLRWELYGNQGMYFAKTTNARLETDVIRYVTAISAQQCIERCMLLVECSAINYNADTGTCEMTECTSNQPRIIPYSPWDYYECACPSR